nr:immunoglobulin light chain junction region [Mus musculus]NSL97549.1 immunoglobulin light chain junction region [Mus musculus]NSL98380.1 immunoglobulin light chain junction region [Mus musculus]NSL98431.1 immunoglobulin light chain junction region [Mus musculus]NSL98538.1 immunoglobulin light chain junction region [Mus musculus]
CQQSNEDPLTF